MIVLMQLPIEYVEKPLKKGEKAVCSLCNNGFEIEEQTSYVLDKPCKAMIINAWIKQSNQEVENIKKMLGWRE